MTLGQSGDKIEHQVKNFVPQAYLPEFKSLQPSGAFELIDWLLRLSKECHLL